MHQIVTNPVDSSHRWWVLAIVVSAQFMFGVDAFIVNVAIPTIATELHASAAQIEAVIAGLPDRLCHAGGHRRPARRYLRHEGRVHRRRVRFYRHLAVVGLAQSGPELIVARLAQGATAALTVPQVLATIHLLFADSARSRAFGIYGIVLGSPVRPVSCSAGSW